MNSYQAPYKEISTQQVADLISENADHVVLDVRTAGELRYGHIPNVLHIDIQGFESHVDELPEDKSRPIICICAHGIRSAAACEILAELGYAHLYNMTGGMSVYTGEVIVG